MPATRRKPPTAQLSLFGQNDNTRKQNNRWVASATTTVRELLDATELTPEEFYGQETDLQRPLDRSHCEALARYYQESSNWVIAPFVFTSEVAPEINEGKMQLPDQSQILDGQHRVQALHLTRNRLESSDNQDDRAKLDRLLESSVALEYISNSGAADARQMFVDLNKTRKISAAELNYLDSRDPVVNAIRETLGNNHWLDALTDKTRNTPTGAYIFSINSLKTVVKAIESGLNKSITKARREYIATPPKASRNAWKT